MCQPALWYVTGILIGTAVNLVPIGLLHLLSMTDLSIKDEATGEMISFHMYQRDQSQLAFSTAMLMFSLVFVSF